MVTQGRGRRIAYVRVVTIEQNPARQLEVVGECDHIFTEKVSGRNIGDRPESGSWPARYGCGQGG